MGQNDHSILQYSYVFDIVSLSQSVDLRAASIKLGEFSGAKTTLRMQQNVPSWP